MLWTINLTSLIYWWFGWSNRFKPWFVVLQCWNQRASKTLYWRIILRSTKYLSSQQYSRQLQNRFLENTRMPNKRTTQTRINSVWVELLIMRFLLHNFSSTFQKQRACTERTLTMFERLRRIAHSVSPPAFSFSENLKLWYQSHLIFQFYWGVHSPTGHVAAVRSMQKSNSWEIVSKSWLCSKICWMVNSGWNRYMSVAKETVAETTVVTLE